MTTDELRKELDSKIPRAAISTRQAGGGVTLDYLTGYYVVARLNEVLGQGNWEYTTDEITKVFEGEVNGKYSTSYIAKVTLSARINRAEKVAEPADRYYDRYGGTTNFTDYGYGDGTDKSNPGKAHELAVKEAVTDGLKRCAKNLGMSLGLALYDKTQENVEDEEVKTVTKSTTNSRASTGQASASPTVETPASTNGDLRKLIRSAVSVLNAQKKLTVDEFKKKYTQGRAADQLTDDEVKVLYKTVATEYPELKLQ
jgi:recombination DNA repair RAD52 pathway protein